MAAKRSPRPPKEQPSWRKVTMNLPRDVAKRLHMLAIDRGSTMGALAAPAIQAMLLGSHFVDRAIRPLAIVAPSETEAEEGSSSLLSSRPNGVPVRVLDDA